MSTHEEVQIGTMPLEAMIARARVANRHAGKPSPGGEYDTLTGWTKRLHMGNSGKLTTDLLPFLEANGLAERVDGVTSRNGSPYPIQLIKSKTLEAKAIEADQKNSGQAT